ncbi:MAG: hypothetical protein IT381_10480 [Deltaproteobacteria bacterium]|nr:hypothetical protein [Deltaproteobacteria bacterium]
MLLLPLAALALSASTPLSLPLLDDARRLTNEPALELRVLAREGSLITMEQTYRGLRVINGKVTAELNAFGRLTHIDRQYKIIRGELPAVNVSVQQAMRTAFLKAGVDFDRLPTPTLDATAALAILAESEQPRLVYELPVLSINPFDRLTALVDATTGQVVRMLNATKTLDSSAKVFDPNPTTNPTPATKTIKTNDAVTLTGALIDTQTCTHATVADLEFYVVPFPSTGEFAQYKQLIEFALGKPINWIVAPLCKEPHKASPAQAGTYAPVMDQSSTAAQSDNFAEVNFFYHADRAANYFGTNGAGNLNAGFAGRAGNPLRGTVNFMAPSIATLLCTTAAYVPPVNPQNAGQVRTQAEAAFAARGNEKDVPNFAKCSDFKNQTQPTSGDFTPFDNAFFLPALDTERLGPLAAFLGAFRPYDSMVFGQGSIDFAYDASIIYHEYTHSIVGTLNVLQDGLAKDKWGLDYAPGAMNEGIADYYASVLTPGLDGCLGPYSAVLLGPGATCLRSLNNDDKCPSSVYGEVHADSEMFSGALWEIRAGFTAANEKAELDKAAFEALKEMPQDGQFDRFFEKLLVKMKAHGLSTEKANAVLAKKNVLACERAVSLKDGDKAPTVNLAGTDTSGGDFAPGFVQYKLEVPALAKKIEVSVTVEDAGRGGFDSLPGNVLGGLGGQEAIDVRLLFRTGKAIEFTYPTGDVPAGAEEVELNKKSKAVFEVEKKTDGPWYVAVVNYNGSSHGLKDLSFKTLEKFEEEKPVGPTGPLGESGATGGTGSLIDTGGTGGKQGCGCHSDAGASQDGFFVLFAIALAISLRRRRRA